MDVPAKIRSRKEYSVIRFLHTGDWQLGMTPDFFSEGVQEGFAQSRFDAIRKLGRITEDEIAFYDALANNDSTKDVLGNDTLRELARILVEKVRANTSIDWTIKESVQAKLRTIIKRTLRKFGYPPDKQLLATENILKQAELFANEWAA